jgi:RNA polymerase sigma-54 factor
MNIQLSLTQTQRMQLGLAPQMRQSLELLQVPLLELQALVQKELEQNPTLEERADSHEPLDPDPESPPLDPQDENLLKLDEEWREYYRMTSAARPPSSEEEARRRFFLDSLAQPETLQGHLLAQIPPAEPNGPDPEVLRLLIGSLNDDGYLNVTLGELSETASLPIAKLETALRALQDMDPIGVGARDLRECLLLQLERLRPSDRVPELLIRDHLEALGANRHMDIAKAMGRPVEEIYRAARFVGTLEPKPGRAFSADRETVVTPDVFVQKTGDAYVATVNTERMPHLRISKFYREMMERPDTPKETRDYIRDKIRASAFLIRSLDLRQTTIQRIAQEILEAQRDFFDHGLSRLRPLIMADIARRVGVHETTVSRTLAGKYMLTPRGLFEMKYFFTPGYAGADGQAVSNKAVMERLQQMVDGEDAAHPLSDEALARRLQAEGLTVARRTVAKYREELKIPPSHERRMTR